MRSLAFFGFLSVMCFGAVVAPTQAVPTQSSTVVTWSFDSGYVDGVGDPITETYSTEGDNSFHFHPILFRSADLQDTESDGTASASSGLVVTPTNFISTGQIQAFPFGPTIVIQDNSGDTAVGPARLTQTIDITVAPDRIHTLFPLQVFQLHVFVSGTVGSGADAYIQFEASQEFNIFDGEDNLLYQYISSVGGDKPLTEDTYQNGAGRITRDMIGPEGGTIDPFYVSPFSTNPFFGDEPVTDGVPFVDVFQYPDRAYITFTRTYIFEAKNDGSPSGVTILDGDTVIPEPASAATLVLLASGLLLKRRSV